MTDVQPGQNEMVDRVFPLACRSLPRDHALGLAQALGAALPWLGAEPGVGVHPVKLVAGDEPRAWLSNRARLLLRVPRRQVQAFGALAGQTLDVAGHALLLGAPHVRELLPHATLYAYGVAAAGDDELVFMEAVARELEALQVRAQRVCGKRRRIAAPGCDVDCFSLMLHGLTPEHSLRLQNRGVGGHRLLGCGVFVPHKSAAAVGA